MKNINSRNGAFVLIVVAAALVGASSAAVADTIDVTVRRAPYNVGGASSKSEKARCQCKYCGSRISYERKSRWDYDRHEWIETTDPKTVPDVCRKCRSRVKDDEKLKRRERDLDNRIEHQRTRLRVKGKEKELEALRKEAR